MHKRPSDLRAENLFSKRRPDVKFGSTHLDGAGVGFDINHIADDDFFFEDGFVDAWI